MYFKSVFWKKKLLEEFGKPLPKFFKICLNLRDVFFKYNKIVQSVCDRERDKDIIEDIIFMKKKIMGIKQPSTLD